MQLQFKSSNSSVLRVNGHASSDEVHTLYLEIKTNMVVVDLSVTF